MTHRTMSERSTSELRPAPNFDGVVGQRYRITGKHQQHRVIWKKTSTPPRFRLHVLLVPV